MLHGIIGSPCCVHPLSFMRSQVLAMYLTRLWLKDPSFWRIQVALAAVDPRANVDRRSPFVYLVC